MLASKVGCIPAGRRTFQFYGRVMNSSVGLCKNLTFLNTGRPCLVTLLSNCMVSTARRSTHLLRSRPSSLMCRYASKVYEIPIMVGLIGIEKYLRITPSKVLHFLNFERITKARWWDGMSSKIRRLTGLGRSKEMKGWYLSDRSFRPSSQGTLRYFFSRSSSKSNNTTGNALISNVSCVIKFTHTHVICKNATSLDINPSIEAECSWTIRFGVNMVQISVYECLQLYQ